MRFVRMATARPAFVAFSIRGPVAMTDSMSATPSSPAERASRWTGVRRVLRRIVDLVPPTSRGFLVLGLAAIALLPFGFADLDLVLFVMGLVGLLLTGVSWLLVAGSAWWAARRLRPKPGVGLDLVTRSRIATGFDAPALASWPLVRFGWDWLEPAAVTVLPRERDGRLIEEVVAERRTIASAVRRRFQVEDVFGLARIRWTIDTPSHIVVLPDPGRLDSMPVVQSLATSDGLPHPSGAPEGDRMEIRRYVPGDSVRHILWKTYARTRELNVRLPERSVDRSQRTVAYLLAGPEDEASAAAARVALERGALGDAWLFGADGSETPTSELDEALLAIARSGRDRNAEPTGAGLERFLEEVAKTGEAHCVVFAPVADGKWILEAVRARAGFAGGLSLVFGTDGVARDTAEPTWQRMLLTPQAVTGTPADRLAKVVRAASAAGATTLVVDRLSGRSYGAVEQRRLAGVA